MQRVLAILLVFTFLVGNWASITHAHALDISISHHASNTKDTKANNSNCAEISQTGQDHAGQTGYQDCCCMHVHVLTQSAHTAAKPLHVQRAKASGPLASLRSNALSPLHRPPIA